MRITRPNQPARATTSRRRRGFTLIEMLLVLAIMGVLAAFAVPQLLGTQKKANIDATRTRITQLEGVLQRYAIAHDGVYPSGDASTVFGLLMSPSVDRNGTAIEPYLAEIPKDAWGNPLQYEYPPSANRKSTVDKPAIWSIGPNGQDGDDDDIVNWQVKL